MQKYKNTMMIFFFSSPIPEGDKGSLIKMNRNMTINISTSDISIKQDKDADGGS